MKMYVSSERVVRDGKLVAYAGQVMSLDEALALDLVSPGDDPGLEAEGDTELDHPDDESDSENGIEDGDGSEDEKSQGDDSEDVSDQPDGTEMEEAAENEDTVVETEPKSASSKEKKGSKQ